MKGWQPFKARNMERIPPTLQAQFEQQLAENLRLQQETGRLQQDNMRLQQANAQLNQENASVKEQAKEESNSRLMVEQELGKTEDRLMLALDAAGLAMWEWDMATRAIYTSSRFGEMVNDLSFMKGNSQVWCSPDFPQRNGAPLCCYELSLSSWYWWLFSRHRRPSRSRRDVLFFRSRRPRRTMRDLKDNGQRTIFRWFAGKTEHGVSNWTTFLTGSGNIHF